MKQQMIKFDRLQASTVTRNDWWGQINGKTIHIMIRDEDKAILIHPETVADILGLSDPVLVTDKDMNLVYSACRKAIDIIKTFSIN
jgi:hypothetical protein